MSSKYDLKYFMRKELAEDEIVEVPGLATFCDDEGNPIPLQIKVLGMAAIDDLRKKHTTNRVLFDEKGKRILDKSGRPIIEKEVDGTAANNRLIVEALVFPDLKCKEMMDFYGVHSVVDMPFKVFKSNRDYQYVSKQVTLALGLSEEEPTDDELIAEAKN